MYNFQASSEVEKEAGMEMRKQDARPIELTSVLDVCLRDTWGFK